MTNDDKLALLRYLIFLRGKLQHLSIELLIEGVDSTSVDQAEQQLAQRIDILRGQVMQDWLGDAQQVMGELRDLNDKAQAKIRDLRSAADKAAKLSEFASVLDQGLQLLAGLVKVAA